MLAAATLVLGLTLGPCALDHATVEVVPPSTFNVMAVVRCGGVTCFVRYVESEGQRIRESKACDQEQGDRLSTGYPK